MNTRTRAIQQLEEADRYCEAHGLTGAPRLGRMVAIMTGHLVERDAEQDFPALAKGQRRVLVTRTSVEVAIDYRAAKGFLEDVCHVWLRGGTDILVLLGCEAILRWAEEAATADAARMADAQRIDDMRTVVVAELSTAEALALEGSPA